MESCPNPIFVIGSPRSGTTILAMSLGMHSKLWASEESEFLFDLCRDGLIDKAFQKALNRPNPSWLRTENVSLQEFLTHLGYGINSLFTSRSQGRRWIDQTPQYGLIAHLLSEMFPGAFFIHILRDGRTVVHSMINIINKYKPGDIEARRRSRHLPPWPQDFKSACNAWRWSVDRAMAFGDANPSRCLTVKNEDLVIDPAAGFARIFDFIGVPHEPGPVDYFRGNRINSSFPESAGDAPSRRDPVRLWEEWSLEQRAIFIGEAGGALVRHGYATESEIAIDYSTYRRTLDHIRHTVGRIVPADSIIAVVSKGDDELLNLYGRRAWHFPQGADTGYSGYHPADSGEAIAALEQTRSRGANYLLVPQTSYWWLEHYVEFRHHIDANEGRTFADEHCTLYRL